MSFIKDNLQINITEVNAEVKKIVINAQLPNPNYDIKIPLITFHDELAEILIDVIEPPNPEDIIIQMIQEKELVTFVDSKYNPTIKLVEIV